jgi:hypothetical protein
VNLAAVDMPTSGWSALCYIAGLALTAFFLWLMLRD